jgi:hypothetical protein
LACSVKNLGSYKVRFIFKNNIQAFILGTSVLIQKIDSYHFLSNENLFKKTHKKLQKLRKKRLIFQRLEQFKPCLNILQTI